jgi:hypothetical protein
MTRRQRVEERREREREHEERVQMVIEAAMNVARRHAQLLGGGADPCLCELCKAVRELAVE